jgi:hypothetical protein
MPQNNEQTSNLGEKTLLASLTLEVDDIFLSLRKADQIIRRELNWLNQHKNLPLKTMSINPINEEKLKKLIEQLPLQNLLGDEYIIYILKNEHNSIFNLIKEYNKYLKKRQTEPRNNNPKNLIDVDEKLVYYIRHLGAMTYHLNIHLNFVNLWLKNAMLLEEEKQVDFRKKKENHTKIYGQ